MKYFNLAGLTYLWNGFKAKIPTKVSDLTNDSKFVSSDNITSILVVDELPAIEEEGVLYLVKQITSDEPVQEYIEYPTMEMGFITNFNELEYSNEHMRTADFVYVGNCVAATISSNGIDRIKVLCYDSNKNLIANWNEDSGTYYSYASIPNGGTLIFPQGTKYIKCSVSSSTLGVLHIIYLENIEYPVMEFGDISRSGDLSDDDTYTRTADFVYVGNCTSVFISNNGTSSTRILCYDEDKNFMTNWNVDGTEMYSYAQLPADGRIFQIPEGCKYMKCKFSSSTLGVLHITYTV